MMIWILALLLVWPAQDAQIEKWIEQLGSEKYKVRESATAHLKKAGKAAVPALKKAAGSKDFEVSARARLILNEISSDAPPLVKAERKATEETRKKLKEDPMSMFLSKTSVQSAMDQISSFVGLNAYVEPDVTDTVTLSVSNLAAADILENMAKTIKGSIVVYHGIVVFSNSVSWEISCTRLL